MKEALERLQAAEAANQLQLVALKAQLQEEERRAAEAVQQKVQQAQAQAAHAYAAKEAALQLELTKAVAQFAQSHEAILDAYEEIMQCNQQQAVKEIVEGVIQTYGSH